MDGAHWSWVTSGSMTCPTALPYKVIRTEITHPTVALLTRLHSNGRWSLSSSSVTLPAGGREVGQPILHGGPVVLRPVRATPCVNSTGISAVAAGPLMLSLRFGGCEWN